MMTSSKSLKREIAFNIDKIYQQFHQYTARLKKNRLIDLYHSLFCTLPASSLVALNQLDGESTYRVNKNQALIASGNDEAYEVMNLFGASLYDIKSVHYSFNNEKMMISLEFNEEIVVNAESRFRFYLHHTEAMENVIALSFLKGNVCGSQAILNHDLEFKSHIDYQNIDSLMCRNQILRQMTHNPQHFCFFDLLVSVATPYKAHSIDFYIELNSYERIGDVIHHLQFNALTLLGLHQLPASRIYLNDADYYPILFSQQRSNFFETDAYKKPNH
ncbi:hypothetical protein [Piscirickettsia litoralis]|uniref:hypothetical protein n=1 Tax=Piscirickettsia litoralis TaxID=1891921 RepID=UPI001F1CA998|nr:hypothetical protein [Piscirickettsia litoralis]